MANIQIQTAYKDCFIRKNAINMTESFRNDRYTKRLIQQEHREIETIETLETKETRKDICFH